MKKPIYCVDELFTYEQWFDMFEDEIILELAENGCDRAMAGC